MFDFFRPVSKRIILINFEGLSVYTLHRNLLVNVARFSHEDAGHENFRHYLAENPKSAVTLLVDSAAEDFIVETVTHVSPLDRRSFLARKADQHFRGVDYRSARIIGREDSGRRNDKVLFSAITKNQALDPWVRVLLKEEIPIRGITTPAYALCKVADEFSFITSENVLLVNWEVSGIRQTFIVDGKMMFSRLTPLPQGPDSELANTMVESCSQSKEYLERIGLLNYGETIDVHIITPHLNDDEFENTAEEKNFRIVMHHNSIDLMQIDRFSGPQRSITAILLCLDFGIRRGELSNIYAPSMARRFYQLIQARKLISTCSLALIVLASLVSAPLILDGIERSARISQLAQDLAPVRNQYQALRAQFPETPIPSEAMEVAVRAYDTIRQQLASPADLLNAVSSIIAVHPSIELSSLNWNLSATQENQNLTTALLDYQSSVSLEIFGVLLDTISVQDSDTRLRQFIDSLSEIEGVTISPMIVPVESDPFSAVNTIINDELVDAEFALSVTVDT